MARHISPRNAISRREMLGAAIAAGSGMLSGCEAMGLEWRYRYRLVGEIQHNGKVFRASSVIEVIHRKGFMGYPGDARGEAVAIDIPGVGTLFLALYSRTLDHDWVYLMPRKAFLPLLPSWIMSDEEVLNRLRNLRDARVELKPDEYPMIVRFRNNADPSTVEQVRPDNSLKSDVDQGDIVVKALPGDAPKSPDLTDIGAHLRGMWIETTDDPVTRTIRNRLPWLKALWPGSCLDGSPTIRTNGALSNRLETLAFERG